MRPSTSELWTHPARIDPDLLVLAQHGQELLSFPVQPEQVIRVGSEPSCTLRLSHGPPLHALLKVYPSGIVVLDLGSPTGTRTGTQSLPPRTQRFTRPGETIAFGEEQVRFQITHPPTPKLNSQPHEQTILDGQFRTIRRLGGGGQAQVWEAIQVKLNRRVALKIVKDPGCVRARTRLRREASLLANLNHPHIVQVYDVHEIPDGIVIVMEHIPGPPLHTLVQPHGLSHLATVRVGQHLASALRCLEQQHVVHRDIKPSNVVLSQDGRARLIDFGIAHTEDATQLTAPGMFVGSLSGAAPEQVTPSADVDHRTDLYALGATLYHLVTGQPPFSPQAAGPAEFARLIHTIRTQPPRPPRLLRPDCPTELQRLILALLNKSPTRRPPSATPVLEHLVRLERSLLNG